MTPLYFSPKQRTTYDFVSLSKIPLFVEQSGREPITDFEPFEDRHFHRAHSRTTWRMSLACAASTASVTATLP